MLLTKVKSALKLKRKSPESIDIGYTPSTYNQAEVFFWQPNNGALNFGDCLSKVIVEKLLYDNFLTPLNETSKPCKLFAIGSVMHFASDNDVIWGAGVNGRIDENEHLFSKLDVRAVRGPLTRDFLKKRGINVPEIYGDPALLLPHLFKDTFTVNPSKKFVFVPNLHDINIAKRNNIDYISPLEPWHVVVNEILKADLVLASSLHGLIIAEAFGIPARHVRLSKGELDFKFLDYLRGTGRDNLESCSSIEEALNKGGMEGIRHFDHLQLLDAFPFDLWRDLNGK